jgi:[glutamine synthetase] adenylyltransferase / [glutamine synthetase]-adenylyl-L-tyrosine phosphorylase
MHKGRHRRIGETDPTFTIDVKIDPGGIRDIEFLVQCLQRVYGGAEPWLRSGGTLFSLQKLHDKAHISGKEFHELTAAYEFLRHVEHRLQLQQGQQTHRLPASKTELTVLQRSMAGYVPIGTLSQDFTNTVRQRMAAVAQIYQRVIYQQQKLSHVDATEADFRLHGMLDASSTDHSNRQILERLAIDAPALYELATRSDLGAVARKNLFRFLGAAFNSSKQYAAIIRDPGAVALALKVFEASEHLTHILVRHPEEIITFSEVSQIPARPLSGYLFETPLPPSCAAGDPVFDYLAKSSAPYGEKLVLLRQQFRHRIFAAGAKDIVELRPVYESLAATTAAVEGAIATAFSIAEAPEGLAVMALGRLGTCEFDVFSDADLVFVCEQAHGRRELLKSAEQIIQALSAYTQRGMVVPVDTRLRPRGNEGELVITPAQLRDYFEQEAQPWEALTYTKLRFLCGSASIGAQAMSASKVLFQRSATDPNFVSAVREMRTKLETPEKNFKTSPGCTYDVDFLTCLLLIKHGIPEKGGTLRDRLWRCSAAGLLDKADAAALDHAAELMRTAEHVVRLVLGRPRRWLPLTEHARQVTEKLTSQILGREFFEGLEAELEQSLREVRKIYERISTRELKRLA